MVANPPKLPAPRRVPDERPGAPALPRSMTSPDPPPSFRRAPIRRRNPSGRDAGASTGRGSRPQGPESIIRGIVPLRKRSPPKVIPRARASSSRSGSSGRLGSVNHRRAAGKLPGDRGDLVLGHVTVIAVESLSGDASRSARSSSSMPGQRRRHAPPCLLGGIRPASPPRSPRRAGTTCWNARGGQGHRCLSGEVRRWACLRHGRSCEQRPRPPPCRPRSGSSARADESRRAAGRRGSDRAPHRKR